MPNPNSLAKVDDRTRGVLLYNFLTLVKLS